LDLGITQKSLGSPKKSLGVRLREEKEEKIIQFFHEQIERRRAREQGRFLDSELRSISSGVTTTVF